MFLRTGTCVVVLALMQTTAQARRLALVIGGSANLAGFAGELGKPPLANPVCKAVRQARHLLEHGLGRAQQERRGLLAPGLPHSGQTKVGQLHDAEAMAPTDAAATPTAPTSMAEPGDADGPRDPALASEKGGSVLVRQGNLLTTLEKYLEALTIAERLAEADPENADWQRDLAVSHEKIGDALLTQSNLLAALANFRASLAIVDRLAKTDPESADRQTELAMSSLSGGIYWRRWTTSVLRTRSPTVWPRRIQGMPAGSLTWRCRMTKIGDVLAQQNKLPVASKSYRASLKIFDRLAKADPENAGGQRQLALAHEKIGSVLVQQGSLASGLESYRFAFAITEHLAQADPGNAGLWSDLATSHLRIGEVLLAQGKISTALESYRASLASPRHWPRPILVMSAGRNTCHSCMQGWATSFGRRTISPRHWKITAFHWRSPSD